MPFGLKSRMNCVGNVERVQFAIDLMLAHAAGDQLGDPGEPKSRMRIFW